MLIIDALIKLASIKADKYFWELEIQFFFLYSKEKVNLTSLAGNYKNMKANWQLSTNEVLDLKRRIEIVGLFIFDFCCRFFDYGQNPGLNGFYLSHLHQLPKTLNRMRKKE